MDEDLLSGAFDSFRTKFTSAVMERLFYWARDRVASIVAQTTTPETLTLDGLEERRVLGAFVSFKKSGRLRSCMGCMAEGIKLAAALEAASCSAATRDPRFPPIVAEEFYDLDLEIWVLESNKMIVEQGEQRKERIKIGRDGILIQGRGRRGLLLPSVAIEMNWNVEQFLEAVCEKAGLARGAWKNDDVQLFTFEGVSFKKPFVWNVSKNREIALLIAERQRVELAASRERAMSNRPSFSLSPSLFRWQVPNVPSTNNTFNKPVQRIREPAVAGLFYPKTTNEQVAELERFDELNMRDAKIVREKDAAGVLVPHAGWIYSGQLAARTFSSVDSEPDAVIVLAPKHKREGANFAVMPCEYWRVGDRLIENDLAFVDDLVDVVPSIKKDEEAHRLEHSIEVQLPLIARYFPKAKVVGILLGRADRAELLEMSRRFSKLLAVRMSEHKKFLLVASSDMNHYANDATTRALDKLATDAIETKEPGNLLDVVLKNNISMCGVLPTFLVLSTLKNLGRFEQAVKTGYTTSGERSGDRERVVGYAGYVFE